MTNPNDERENRENLSALASLLRCVANNYSRLSLEVKQTALKDVRAALAGLGGSKLSLDLVEHLKNGQGEPDPATAIFAEPCDITPRGTRNCFWGPDTTPETKAARKVRVLPGHLDRGIEVIYGELEKYSDIVAAGMLQDLAIMLEWFEVPD